MHHFFCFALVTVAILAFIKHVVRRHRYGCAGGYGSYEGYGGGCGRSYYDEEGPSFRHGGRGGLRGFGFRAVLRRLFERLETTPGQEKVIVSAAEELKETLSHAKDEMKGSRTDFAEAFRRGPIDEAAMADIFVRHDTVISETRRKVVEAIGRIHEALDDSQRAQLADIIEKGPGFGRHHGRRSGYPWA